MILEIKIVFFTKSKLKQVVVERFLGDTNFIGSFFQAVAHYASVSLHSIVKSAPEAHLSYDVLDRTFLHSLSRLSIAISIIVLLLLCLLSLRDLLWRFDTSGC